MSTNFKNKKKSYNAIEMLEAMGHENEQEGIKYTKYFMDKWDRDQWEKQQIQEEKLGKAKKFRRVDYHKKLRGMLNEMVLGIDRVGPGYWAETGFNEKGVWARLHDKYGRTWQRGIKPSGIPKVDYRGSIGLAAAIEMKMIEIENDKDPKSKGGIHLPTKSNGVL